MPSSRAEEIKGRLKNGNFRLSLHALERMSERVVVYEDIRSVGRTARRCFFQPEKDTWRTEGTDLDGERLVVICTFEADVLVVTVF